MCVCVWCVCVCGVCVCGVCVCVRVVCGCVVCVCVCGWREGVVWGKSVAVGGGCSQVQVTDAADVTSQTVSTQE